MDNAVVQSRGCVVGDLIAIQVGDVKCVPNIGGELGSEIASPLSSFHDDQ